MASKFGQGEFLWPQKQRLGPNTGRGHRAIGSCSSHPAKDNSCTRCLDCPQNQAHQKKLRWIAEKHPRSPALEVVQRVRGPQSQQRTLNTKQVRIVCIRIRLKDPREEEIDKYCSRCSHLVGDIWQVGDLSIQGPYPHGSLVTRSIGSSCCTHSDPQAQLSMSLPFRFPWRVWGVHVVQVRHLER